MGRERKNSGNPASLEPAVLADMLLAMGRRQISLLFTRYRFFLLVGVAVLFVWVCLGGGGGGYGRRYEPEVDPPPLPQKLGFKPDEKREFSDFDSEVDTDPGELKTARDQMEQELRKEKIQKERKADRERAKLLFPPAGSSQQFPARDLQGGGGVKMAGVERSSVGRSNYVNGVAIPNVHPDDTFEWAAVGASDIYHQQQAAGPGAAGHDEFAAELAKQVPGTGEGGSPVILTGREKELGEEIMKTEAFNLVISDKISYTRSVPDTRDSRCLSVYYDSDLPTTSVVIIFTNEAWSPLIRTIYSVLNRSPPQYIHEIILVDDFSDKKHLGSKLERFIHKYFPSKVKLMRLNKREGLIRARLEGAKRATGDVILFLDSHCECNSGWLEPLLQRIKENPMAFVVPIIDVIDDKTLEYYHGNGNYFQVGGFTWAGHFTWVDISVRELNRRGSAISPTRSPTMAGGLFAVLRKTFWALGSYDSEMDVWGGENLEMSFRIWQCGGVLETIPCSRVGHIFRSFHPYSFPGNKDTHGINTARTVEVWMDEYKRLFYMHRPDLVNTEIGSVEARNLFKAERQCKPFQWFLDNIYPEKFILDDPKHVFAYGRMRNPTSGTCLDNLQNDEKDQYELGQYQCHTFMAAAQFFSFSRQYELRREEKCATVTAPFPAHAEKVIMANCHNQLGDQEWAHTKEGRIIHKATKKCLDAGLGHSMDILFVAPCQNTPSQVWYFDHYLN